MFVYSLYVPLCRNILHVYICSYVHKGVYREYPHNIYVCDTSGAGFYIAFPPPHCQLQMRGNCNIKKMAPKLQDSLMWYLVFEGAGVYITFPAALSAGNAGKFTRTHTLPRKVREFQNTGECDITKMVPKLHCPPHFRLKMRRNVIYRPAP